MTLGSRRTDLTDSPRRIAAALLVALIGVTALALIRPGVAAAAVGEPPSFQVVDQTPFVAADGVFSLTLSIDLEPPSTSPDGALKVQVEPVDHELAVTVYGLVDDEAGVDHSPSEPLNRLDPVPLADLPRTEGGGYRLDIPVRAGPPFDGADRVLLPNAGVYPVTIELRSDEGPLATARTNLIRLPAEVDGGGPTAAALPPVAMVVPVSIADGLTAADAVGILATHPDLPVTLLLQQGVVNQLRTDPALTAELVAALAGRPVVAPSDYDLDPSALTAIGQENLFLSTIRAARADLVGLGFTVDERLAVLDAPLTEGGISTMAQLGVRHVIGDDHFGRDARGSLGYDLRILDVDEDLSASLADRDPAAVHRILASLAVRALTDPSPVIVGGAVAGIQPAAVDGLLRALGRPGAPQLVLLPDAAATARLPLRPAELPEQDLVPIAELLVGVQNKLRTYDSFYQSGGTAPADYRLEILSTLARTRNPDDRMRALTRLDASLDAELGVIGLPPGHPVTLAARSAPIPLIVQSEASGPRSVMLRFRSDKVMTVDDEQIVVIRPGTSSIDVEVEALSLGVSPLEISVWTPDGTTNLATTRFEIRSTAVPGLGSLAGLAGVGFLIIWWMADANKRRLSAPGGREHIRNERRRFER